MIELKTINEVKLISKNAMFNVGASSQFETIKNEAIIWVKELMISNNVSLKKTHPFYKFKYDSVIIITFIKDRFDITDEDIENFVN